jgi:ribonuclease HI
LSRRRHDEQQDGTKRSHGRISNGALWGRDLGFSDSQYCVSIVTTWAANWKKNGWTRGKKKEEIKNLDLVMELHELATLRPSAKAEWIKGHAGNRWNEYADALSRPALE